MIDILAHTCHSSVSEYYYLTLSHGLLDVISRSS